MELAAKRIASGGAGPLPEPEGQLALSLEAHP